MVQALRENFYLHARRVHHLFTY